MKSGTSMKDVIIIGHHHIPESHLKFQSLLFTDMIHQIQSLLLTRGQRRDLRKTLGKLDVFSFVENVKMILVIDEHRNFLIGQALGKLLAPCIKIKRLLEDFCEIRTLFQDDIENTNGTAIFDNPPFLAER